MAISRVAMRVTQGGHNVSRAVIRRRFEAGLRNFKDVYMHLVDKWEWYDNSGNEPQLVSAGRNR
jgi:predicted ABC-type ATPase